MPIVRSHPDSDFTAIPNALLQDTRLSCCDLGLLVQLLSRPPDWIISTSRLNKMYKKRTGKESIAKSVKRLQQFGYLTISRERSACGRLGAVVWTVYDTPQLQNAVMEPPQPGKPECGSPQVHFAPVVAEQKEPPQPGKPESGFPPYTKERIYKNKKAAPAVEGGAQPSRELYYDSKTEEWRRKECT